MRELRSIIFISFLGIIFLLFPRYIYAENNSYFPRFIIILNDGYGLFKVKENHLSPWSINHKDGFKIGSTTGIQITYVWNHANKIGIGMGLKYSGFSLSVNKDLVFQLGSSKKNIYINYVAPQFVCVYPINSSLLGEINVGIGYAKYYSEEESQNKICSVDCNALGINIGPKLNYFISKHFGLCFEISFINGFYSKINRSIENKKDLIMGHNAILLRHIDATIGLFAYF